MPEHRFDLRLVSRHEGTDNAIAQLEVEVRTADGWVPLDLSVRTAGFLIFVYSAFICQHLFMRVNAAERGLLLDTVEGSFHLESGADWHIKDALASFDGSLRGGTATTADLDYIRSRMAVCPVSRNLSGTIRSELRLHAG